MVPGPDEQRLERSDMMKRTALPICLNARAKNRGGIDDRRGQMARSDCSGSSRADVGEIMLILDQRPDVPGRAVEDAAHHPSADARLRRQAFERPVHLLLGASEMDFLVQSELHRLLQRVESMSSPAEKEEDDVGVRRLGLDEIGGKVPPCRPGSDRRRPSFPPAHVARLDQPSFKRVAEGVVGRDVVPPLAILLDEGAGDGVRLHLRGVADAEDVPVAARAGDRVGVAAGHNMPGRPFRSTPAPSRATSAELTLPSRKLTLSPFPNKNVDTSTAGQITSIQDFRRRMQIGAHLTF